MDGLDRQLLTLIRKEIPIQSRPFEGIGEKIGIDSADVLLKIYRFRKEGTIHQISAIFDSKKLGYQSMLIAFSVPETELPQAVAWINSHPGVVYHCRRNHDYNLWFTLAVPSEEDFKNHLERLREGARARGVLVLPTLKLFRSGFSPDGANDGLRSKNDRALALTPVEINAIRILQRDMPLSDTPYQKMAADFGWPEETLLLAMRSLIQRGFLRRVAADQLQDRTESTAHAMVVWQVPEERQETVGNQMASCEGVAHCAKRPIYREFPYDLYTLIRAKKISDCKKIVEGIEAKAGPWPRAVLLNVEEYKKEKIKYFPKELNTWLERNRHQEIVGSPS